VHELSLAPGFQLDDAVAHGLVIVSTSLAGIAAVARHAESLSQEPACGWALGDPGPVRSLLFFDLNQLLRLAEQTGLVGSTRLASLWPDLQKIRAVGLASRSDGTQTTTEL
jgi:hypothetical protein